MTILEQIKKDKIIAILRGVQEEKILPLCQALSNGGVTMIEVTFNQSSLTGIEDTCRAIKMIGENLGHKVRVGAGTVMTIEQAEAAVEAGAEYLISPHFSEAIVKKTIELGATALPGVLTPTEITAAYEAGAAAVKIFPIHQVGGPGYLNDVLAPISHIPMLAVGGVNLDNARAYLEAGAVGLGLGSNIANKALIEGEKYDELQELARAFTEAVK